MTAVASPPIPALSPEQQAAADRLAKGIRNQHVQTMGGYAGTGKTTVASWLFDRLPGFGVCAYTGKAADILRRKGLPAQTIHSTIYRPREDSRGRMRFELKSDKELGLKGFLVDEGSMVGRDLFRDLKSFGLPIIVIGDHGQLPPVGEDAGLMRNPDIRLETIHRNAGPIARFAEHLRKGGEAATWESPTGKPGVFVVGRKDVTDGHLVRAEQIICAFNNTRVGLNRQMRRLLEIDDDGGREPMINDRVMCLRNDRPTGVFNGQQGTIAEIDRSEHSILFQPTYGEAVWVEYDPESWHAPKTPKQERFEPGRLIPFDFAYAVTTHKAQGDEWGKIAVFEEKCDLWEHSRWAYTAASRAKDALLWIKA